MKAEMRARRRTGRWFGVLAIFLLLLLAGGAPAVHAQEAPRLQITRIDAADFPDIRLHVIATGPDGRRLAELPRLRVNENRTAVEDVAVGDVAAGIELIFVLDDNASFADRDSPGDLTRAEKVRDSIVLFASQYMDAAQLDRVSVIAPGEDGGRLVLTQAPFSNEVINEANFYEPVTLSETPLQEMMALALRQAATSRQEGRYQAIVLFTDGAELDLQLDFPAIVEQAQRGRVTLFGAILGARADPNEIENVTALTGPTGGEFVHLSDVSAIEPIYARLHELGTQYELTYRSQLAAAGERTVTVDLAGARDEIAVRVDVAPPAVELAVDNSRPIVRALPAPDAALSAAEPAEQPLALRVTWPDGHPRALSAASLFVDGEAQLSVDAPEMDAAGLVSLPWDIRALDEGAYEVQVRVTDELGLAAESAPMTFEVEIAGRLVVAEVTATAPMPAAAEPEAERGLLADLGQTGLFFGLLAGLGAGALLVIAAMAVRRRRAEPLPAVMAALETPAAVEPAAMAAPAARRVSRAYLEPVENAGEHGEAIPLAEPAVKIGRDPMLAQIVFSDKSVSRLHARIDAEGGVYRLYDEGSASGTYRNYEQVGLTPQVLADNDDVHFGRVHVRFHLAFAEAAASEEPTGVMPARPDSGPAGDPDDGDVSTRP